MQILNPEMVNLLSAIFPRRNEPNEAWAKAFSAHMGLPRLVGYWPLNQRNASYEYFDYSGNDKVLTPAGVGLANFMYGLQFGIEFYVGGVSGWMERTDAELNWPGGGWAVGGWFKFDTVVGLHSLISKWNSSGNQMGYILYVETGAPKFLITTDGATGYSKTGTTITANSWHHIVGEFYPSTKMSIWVDGVESYRVDAVPATIFGSNADFELGTNDAHTLNYFNGQMCHIFVSNSAGIGIFIKTLFQQTRGLFGV